MFLLLEGVVISNNKLWLIQQNWADTKNTILYNTFVFFGLTLLQKMEELTFYRLPYFRPLLCNCCTDYYTILLHMLLHPILSFNLFPLRFCHRYDGRYGFEKNILSSTVSYTALPLKTDLHCQPTLS